MASQSGVIFRVSTFGESHGVAVGCIIDGCPAGISINIELIQKALARRRPGQSMYTTSRNEEDSVQILSGVQDGISLGTPIALMVKNADAKSDDYAEVSQVFRPGHADFSYQAKFGIRAQSGGGRASARETIARVAAGSVAQQMLSQILTHPIEVIAWVQRMAHIACPDECSPQTHSEVEIHPLRVPHAPTALLMEQLLTKVMDEGDTVGGLIRCHAKGVPTGWGEQVFDKLEADLAKAMLSLPAARSFEIGTGLASTFLKGSENNDAFSVDTVTQKVITQTNNCGGILGGISTGMPIELSVGFKPVSSIRIEQNTVNTSGQKQTLKMSRGRHDPCVLPRAVPLVEAMTWLVLADHALRAQLNRKQQLIQNPTVGSSTQQDDAP